MRRFLFPLAVSALLLLGGCTARDASWGHTATLFPSIERIAESAGKAAIDPLSWAPLGAAACFRIDDYDAHTVEWASGHTPLLGSRDNALETSDRLKSLSEANYWASTLAAETRPGMKGLYDRSKAMVAGWGIMALNARATDSLKSAIGRERPDASNARSFPSGHTTKTAVAATLAGRNIDHAPLSPTAKRLWQGASYGTAALTGWARVEAGVHYPSDVLASYALGHFLAAFLNDAFIVPPYRESTQLSIRTDAEAIAVTLHYRW